MVPARRHRGRAAVWTAAVVAVALMAGTGGAPAAVAAEPTVIIPDANLTRDGDRAAGRVLVRFEIGASAAAKGRARAAVAAGASDRGRRLGLVPGLELLETTLPVDLALERLGAMPGVLYAAPDRVVHAAALPNDPLLPDMWGLEQPSDVDIDASGAWGLTGGGDPSIVVAVIDTGLDMDHPDLAPNLWTNPGEVPGNGLDDDDNGYVDDVHGWDFVADDADPDDENGHGTHTSGTIAAVGDNGTGVAGVAYRSRLMPLRILDEDGFGHVSDAVRAIGYASRLGVRISNHSWGAGGGASQPLRDAIEAAGARGHLLVAAAGNFGFDTDQLPFYPASFDLPNVISVGAMTQGGELASFSNFGAASVDVAAPGEEVLSTYLDGGYGFETGTSMASPHVAGVAALVLSLHPDWTAAQVRDRILGTVRPVHALEGMLTSGGMLNAAAAVAASPNRAPVVTITKPAGGSSVLPGTTVTFAATAVDPEQENVASSITWVSNLMGRIGGGASISRSDLEPGTHVITAIARDAAGHAPLAAIMLRVGPEIRTIAEGGDLRTPVIAAAPDGTPIVGWTEHGIGTIVSRFTGGAWSREVVSRAYLDAWPDLGVEPDGKVRLFVQREWASVGVYGDSGILAATDDGTGAGTGWTTERVSEACGDDAEGCGEDWTPAWARDASGTAHVAWVRGLPALSPAGNAGNSPGIWHAIEHANGTWSAEQVLELASGLGALDLATGPGDSVHLSFARTDPGNEGAYHATDETGSWVVTRLSGDTAAVVRTRVAVSAAGVVDVVWASRDGVVARSRSAGSGWGDPATISPDPVGDLDLVRDGASLHLVLGRVDETGTAAGVAYATSSTGAGPWTVSDLDAGQDVHPRLAVDGAGRVHVSYLRASPEVEIRHVTNAGGSWLTDVVARGWTWEAPAFAVDASGVRHVAVGRYGTQPGVWYGTDAGESWTLERLTGNPPDGPVGLAVAPDGTAAISYGESLGPDHRWLPPAERAVWVTTGKPGGWTTTRIADNAGTGTHPIVRDAAGKLHLAIGIEAGDLRRIGYATNASGGWVVTPVTPGAAGDSDRWPSLALDAAGKVHIAYEASLAEPDVPSPGIDGSLAARYVTNASGSWVVSTLASGRPFAWHPSIAVDASGRPRVALWLDNLGGAVGTESGVRLLTSTGSAWTTTTPSSHPDDVQPSVVVDGAGRTHVLFARGSLDYGVCQVPLCSANPGLRYWTDAPGFGPPRRVTDHGDDTAPALVLGLEGSVSGAFRSAGWRLGEIRLQRPLPVATAPVVHLRLSGKQAQGRATVTVTFSGSNGASYRLQLSTNGGGWVTKGSVSSSTTRTVDLVPGPSVYRFRVVPNGPGGVTGASIAGSSFRVRAVSERSSAVTYRRPWRTVAASSFYGGRARHATSSTAKARFTFTGREVAWIAALGPTRGKARVYVDGAYAGTVKLRSSKASHRRIVFRKILASSGSHTLVIRPTGSGRVDVDGFFVLR